MEANKKPTTMPTRTRSIDSNVASITKSPPRVSPPVSTGSSTSVTSPSDNSAGHKGDKSVFV